LRIAVADGYFAQGAEPEALEAVAKIARAINVKDTVTLPESNRARAAAYIITAAEGANLHFANLRSRPQDFDPATRDRFLAGTMMPATWYIRRNGSGNGIASRFKKSFKM
jgi:Asp-tRNA(Asn)/Glu-tRNA(Gln) amidotransferase A subunit family amidase